MASLFRKPTTITDPVTGKKVTTKSKKWWGQYKAADGIVRRKSLSIDRMAAQAMLNELVKRVEREKAGLVDPTEDQRKRPLSEHLAEFERHLGNKGSTEKYVDESMRMLKAIVKDRKWRTIADISASDVIDFLSGLRRKDRSAQTCNNYLTIAKHFVHWLVRDRRTPFNPLTHLSRMNVRTDRRHDRRAFSQDEFRRLLQAAESGKPVEGISGPDRAMIYTLAAWTGFRRGEIGSLTKRSFSLDSSPATVTVEACYSKRRREDTQVLHPDVVKRIKAWFETKKRLGPSTVLFPISNRVPGGVNRRTSKMIERDLMAARDKWLDEAKTDEDLKERLESDFLCYCNHDDLYADFHSLRHLFITNLERAGVTPKMAQTLARHSDIRLTLGVYTHVELHDQTAAIESLPGLGDEQDDNEADAA